MEEQQPAPGRRGLRRWIILIAVVLAIGLCGWVWRDWFTAQFYLGILEQDQRVRSLQRERVVRELGLEAGQRVADVGAGTGIFCWPLARAVGAEGRVFAVDVNRTLLRHVADQAAGRNVSNVHTVLAAPDDPRIPEPVDLVFLCDTLHHIQDRGRYLKTLRRYLRPSGRVAVIDFGEDSPHLMTSMKYSFVELQAWMAGAGFELEARHDFLSDNFFVVYRCRGCPD